MSVCLFVLVGTRTHTRAHSLTHAHTHKRAAHSLGVSTAAALSLSTVVSCFRTSPAMALAFLAACCCFGDVADDETLTRLKQSSGGRVRDDERSLLYIYLFFFYFFLVILDVAGRSKRDHGHALANLISQCVDAACGTLTRVVMITRRPMSLFIIF